MKIKSKLSLVAFISCCAITSVGFANWVITQKEITNNANGGVFSDVAILSDDYIYFSHATPLRVNKGGFTNPQNENQTILSGSFSATFIVNADNFMAAFSDGATTEITLKFAKNPANNVFATDDSIANINVERENNSNLVNTVVGTRSNGTFLTTLGINSSQITSGTATFTLMYTFSFADKTDYKNYIYNVFYPDGADESKAPSAVQFAFEISIKEK